MRLALWRAPFTREGPGLLLRDILASDPEILAARDHIRARAPDVILLQRFDFDLEGRALAGLQALLADAGHPMLYAHAPLPNAGLPSGIDLDGDGRRGRYDDSQGFGRFQGSGAMALLSRFPIRVEPERDFTGFLWRDLPDATYLTGAAGPPAPEAAQAVQRLASVGAWEVEIVPPGGTALRLLAWHAGPPLFGSVPGRNSARNHDENRFWSALLAGELPFAPPASPFVLMGSANLDPAGREGCREGIRNLLASPSLFDPRPADSHGGIATAPPGADDTRPRRSAYLLPARGLAVVAAGLDWPERSDAHALVWIDLLWPP